MHNLTAAEKRERHAEAIESLRKILRPGDTVYVATRHVSRSGMSRHLTVHVIRPGRDIDNALRAGGYAAGDNPDPDPADYQLESITWRVAHALGWPLIDGADQWRVRVDGAGMDMHFHLVHSLGRTLWPEGFQPGDGSNRYNPNRFERDGGYALTKVSI